MKNCSTLLFGISGSYPIAEQALKIGTLLGYNLEERESIYRGGRYFILNGDNDEIIIVQRNIELDNYLAEEDYPNSSILIYIDSTIRPEYWIDIISNKNHVAEFLWKKECGKI
jgi:hypothetical protein